MQTIAPLWLWITFVVIVLVSLFVDFVVLRKQGAHEIGVKEALNWSLIWIAMSFLFNGLFWWAVRRTAPARRDGQHPLAGVPDRLPDREVAGGGQHLRVPDDLHLLRGAAAYQKRVLMIGIVGAIVLRTVMILVGGWLLAHFHWILYVFGAFLVLTGVKMWWAAGKEPDWRQPGAAPAAPLDAGEQAATTASASGPSRTASASPRRC
jgi:tellurite resistance protein TerC